MKSRRYSPLIGAGPTFAINSPSAQAASPFKGFTPVSMPTIVRDRIMSIICSPNPMARSKGTAKVLKAATEITPENKKWMFSWIDRKMRNKK